MKKEILKPFIEKEISSAKTELHGYIVDNQGRLLYWRPLFYRLDKFVRAFINGSEQNRWIVMPGLRGTGKTTLLAQLYFNLINVKKIKPENIVYLSLDRISKLMKSDLFEAIACYEEITGEKLEERKEKLFLLIDEAHYDKKWDTAVKAIFDKSKKTFIIVTGSSALALHGADSARRVQKEHLFPLSFIEYIMLKFRKIPIRSLKEKIESIILNSKNAQIAFESLKKLEKEINIYWKDIGKEEITNYLISGTLGFALELENEEVFKRIRTILDRIVYEDLTILKEFDRVTLNKIWNLLLILATCTDTINLESLSQKIGIARATLVSVLDILSKSELLFPIKAFGSPMKQVRKSPRYIFLAPIIKASLLWESGQFRYSTDIYGRLFEDVSASYLYRIKETKGTIDIKYDSEKGGADFIILNKDGTKIILEVGYGNKSQKQVLQTMYKIKAKYGILISEKDFNVKQNILFLPKKFFLLL